MILSDNVIYYCLCNLKKHVWLLAFSGPRLTPVVRKIAGTPGRGILCWGLQWVPGMLFFILFASARHMGDAFKYQCREAVGQGRMALGKFLGPHKAPPAEAPEGAKR